MGKGRDNLKNLLKGAGSAGQLAGVRAVLPGGVEEAGARITAISGEEAPLRVIYVPDMTASMKRYVHAVLNCVENVGREVLDVEKGIEAAVFGVTEHRQNDYKDFTPQILNAPSIQVVGDFLQTHDWTTDPAELRRQVADLVLDEGNGNNDPPEAYECAADHISQVMVADRETNPDRKYVVVWLGDACPHGTGYFEDIGCPRGTSPDTLRTLAQIATHSYWVDCNPQEEVFAKHTYGPLAELPDTTYLEFGKAEEVLPEALTAMVKKIQGPTAYQTFLDVLPDPNKARIVKGLLNGG